MKKTIKNVIALFVMVVVLAMASNTAEAASYTGGDVTNLQQTNATESSFTISWTPAQGAVKYYITDASTTILGETTDTTFTLQFTQNNVAGSVFVFPEDANGQLGLYYYDSVACKTLPTKITGVKYYNPFASSLKLNVCWNDSPVADGFEAVCYNKSGKVVQVNDVTAYKSTQFSKTNTQNIYSIEIKPYILVANGTQKLYGASSDIFYAVPQPKVTIKKSELKSNSVVVRWKKVKGAKKYTIYMSQKKNSGYKKIATVGGSKTSYKITKFKGKTLNVHNKTHYIKIVTQAKFGKKTVKSSSKPQYSVRTYTVYR